MDPPPQKKPRAVPQEENASELCREVQTEATVRFQDAGFRARFNSVTVQEYEAKYAPHKTPIVIDIGTYGTRAGFATDHEPRLCFRSLVTKIRTKDGKRFYTFVGNEIPYEEAWRLKPKSPFHVNVLYNIESMEYILDHIFDGLGLSGCQGIDHPIILTEAICNPNACRSKLSKLLFECYGVPSVFYGIGDLFDYLLHTHKGKDCPESLSDGLIVSSSHKVSHIIPVVDGDPDFLASVCIPVGSFHSHGFMLDRLLLRYPYLAQHLSLNRCFELNHRFAAFVPGEFLEELSRMQRWRDGKRSEAPMVKPVILQLPFVEQQQKVITEEQKTHRERRRKENAERLRAMAKKRSEEKLAERLEMLASMDMLAERLEANVISEAQFLAELKQGGFQDRNDFERTRKGIRKKIDDTIARKRKRKREREGNGVDEDDKSIEFMDEESRLAYFKEKYPLLYVDASTLSEEQKKEKRKQVMWRGAEESRMKRKQEKLMAKKSKQNQLAEEDEKYRQNPEEYIKRLHSARGKITENREKRKEALQSGDRKQNIASRRKALQAVIGPATAGGAGKPQSKGFSKSKPKGNKEEDTFGANEDDWDLYKQMAKARGDDDENDDSESEQEKQSLQWIEQLLEKYDPASLKCEKEKVDTLRASDFQIELFVELVKAPEILFQPSIIGLECVGLSEALNGVFRKLGSEKRNRVCRNVFVTGGNTLFPNFCERLKCEIQSECPLGFQIKVQHTEVPIIGAWKGAQKIALNEEFVRKHFLTKEEYFQHKGMGGYVKRHSCSNRFYPTPK